MSRTRHRVAVVVFADAEGCDEMDASHAAVYAIRAAIGGDRMHLPNNLPIPLRNADGETTRVVDVMDVGMALGNGYLWTRPTKRAWNNQGLDETEEDA